MATTKTPGRTDQQRNTLQRVFGDLEVVDAKADLRIPVVPADFQNAERKNPERCVLAQACIRGFDSTAAVFFRSVAYIDLVGPDGKRRVERYVLPTPAQKIIRELDEGTDVPDNERMVTLIKPTTSRKLDEMTKRRVAWRKAVAKGEHIPNPQKRPEPKEPISTIEIRDGRGMWQTLRESE